MGFIVADTPYTYCLVRAEFLRDLQSGHGDYERCQIIGVTALEGRLPCFTVLIENGAMWTRLPIHAFVTKPCDPLPAHALCIWDSLSYWVSCHAYKALGTLVCDAKCGDGEMRRGTYLFTLDWAMSDHSEMPDQHKCHHIIAHESGHIGAYPNNRLRWHEPSWIKPFDKPPDYKVQTTEWTAERDRVLADGTTYFYAKQGESASEQEVNEVWYGKQHEPWSVVDDVLYRG